MHRSPADPYAAPTIASAENSRFAPQHDGVVFRPAERLHALPARQPCVDIASDGRRADKRHRVDLRMVKDGVDGLLIAVHHVEHSVGKPGLLEKLAQQH
jgi:hypothetical protein